MEQYNLFISCVNCYAILLNCYELINLTQHLIFNKMVYCIVISSDCDDGIICTSNCIQVVLFL